MAEYNSMEIIYEVQYLNGWGRWDKYASFDSYKDAKQKAEQPNIAIEKGDDPYTVVNEPSKHCRIIQTLIMKHEMEY